MRGEERKRKRMRERRRGERGGGGEKKEEKTATEDPSVTKNNTRHEIVSILMGEWGGEGEGDKTMRVLMMMGRGLCEEDVASMLTGQMDWSKTCLSSHPHPDLIAPSLSPPFSLTKIHHQLFPIIKILFISISPPPPTPTLQAAISDSSSISFVFSPPPPSSPSSSSSPMPSHHQHHHPLSIPTSLHLHHRPHNHIIITPFSLASTLTLQLALFPTTLSSLFNHLTHSTSIPSPITLISLILPSSSSSLTWTQLADSLPSEEERRDRTEEMMK